MCSSQEELLTLALIDLVLSVFTVFPFCGLMIVYSNVNPSLTPIKTSRMLFLEKSNHIILQMGTIRSGEAVCFA